jgi:hypothetical protein
VERKVTLLRNLISISSMSLMGLEPQGSKELAFELGGATTSYGLH